MSAVKKRTSTQTKRLRTLKVVAPSPRHQVLGILQRDGKVFAIPVKNTQSKTIKPIIESIVEKGTKVMTDEWTAYKSLDKIYEREIVCHSAGEYVKGEAHTNNIENFWAHFKRTIVGTYFHMSDEHLASYVNESAYRYNNRDLSEGSRFDVTLANCQKRLTWNELIARKKKRA